MEGLFCYDTDMKNNHGIIRTIYLYLFALVGLFIFVFSTVNLIGAVLDRFVFPQEFVDYELGGKPIPVPGVETRPEIVTPDTTTTVEERKANFEKQTQNSFKNRVNSSLPGVLIGFLLWTFHWRWIKKDHEA